MSWISLVGALITLALEVVRYLQRKDSYDKLALEATKSLLESANEMVKRADLAAAAVRDNKPDPVFDADNRDNDGR